MGVLNGMDPKLWSKYPPFEDLESLRHWIAIAEALSILQHCTTDGA